MPVRRRRGSDITDNMTEKGQEIYGAAELMCHQYKVALVTDDNQRLS